MAVPRRPAALVAALVVVALGVAGPAATGARAEDQQLIVRSFTGGSAESGGVDHLDLVWTGDRAGLADLQVSENGQTVDLTARPEPLERDRGVVFVVDSGKGMNQANVLPEVRDAIVRAANAHPGIDYAVVQAGDRADLRADFTGDGTRLRSALDGIGPTEGSAVWNALDLAASMLGERGRLQPNIVLVTADDDTVAPDLAPVARSAVAANAALVFTLAFTGEGSHLSDLEPYHALHAVSGGRVSTSSEQGVFAGQLTETVATVADRQYTASWVSSTPDGDPVHLDVSLGGLTDSVDVLAGRGAYHGYEQLHPALGAAAATLPLTDNKVALALALLLALGGVAGAAYALTMALVQEDLANVLQPYADAYGLIDGESAEPAASGTALARSALVQRAVAITEQVAENQGLLTRAEAALERANLPLRAGEALFFYVILVVALTLIPLLLTRNVVTGLAAGVLSSVLPVVVVDQIARKRRKDFLSQLPDTLSLLSGTLKAGYSLMQGVEAVSQEVAEPMGLELRRVVTESRLGRPLEESLEASADRMDSPDFAWAVMAIRIQREVGGNLAELLLTVADTMIARERLRRDVAALTAEGRVSAYMLAGMPPILAAVMYVLNQEYVSTLFTNTIGWVMIGLAVLSMIIGFFWMKKIITIEI